MNKHIGSSLDDFMDRIIGENSREAMDIAAQAKAQEWLAETMVERVAKAIFTAGWDKYPDQDRPAWSDIPPDGVHYAQVRAAIFAMLEPSPEMIKAGSKAMCSNHGSIPAIWDAMVGEALNSD